MRVVSFFSFWLSVLLVLPLLASSTIHDCSDSAILVRPRTPQEDVSHSSTSPIVANLISRSQEEKPANVTIHRCRAQELPQGEALWIVLVLGIASVVHMPGSVTSLGHKGLYRLVPEFGIVEAVGLLVLVARGKYYYKQSFRLSVKAALALRYALGEGQSWWLGMKFEEDSAPVTTGTLGSVSGDEDSPSGDREQQPPKYLNASEAFRHLDPFLSTLRTFSQSRLLVAVLATLAVVKACAVTGTVRTTFIGLSYYFSFFIIEMLAWIMLEPGQPPSRGELESEAFACARLIADLDPFQDSVGWGRNNRGEPAHQLYSSYLAESGTAIELPTLPESTKAGRASTLRFTTAYFLMLVMAGFAVVQLFWPVSVPLFILYDFSSIQAGKWTFIYLTSVVWLFWASAAALVILLCMFGVSKLAKRDVTELLDKTGLRQWRGKGFLLSAYIALKVALIVRLFLTDYTGQNTRKPDWVDWLG